MGAHLFGERDSDDSASPGYLSAIPSLLAQVACSLRACIMLLPCNLLSKRNPSQREEWQIQGW